ncbi:DMT family transporter [Paenibacillus phoenicis]|jgi:drug/metabolite transporter (DMT)-like permease|uniref:DMT family transporter n=1 Tax=Paenibacillus phoenicis TaxID=554117 RepID=A0ABU5PQ76_9BACL|nr:MULTISPECIES: DMT family transporter [Paenibacillus]MCT2194236.1 DMT family transporter [Paenibacillus sp. p3-SID1389]MEA3572111.1 DMT family transporter [Paenibacillus phoenicis]
MWFLFALLTSLAWGSADLFYKKGSDSRDPFSHLKIVVMVGLVMGIHGTAYLLIQGLSFDPIDMIRYLPVSALYILSMAIGYFGLRYIELSIASPVQNSSGAVTAILLYLFFPHDLGWMDITGVAIITFGVVGLAILEKQEERMALKSGTENLNAKYQIGVMAITFPLLYCLLDGLGTFADGIYLDELKLIGEDAALLAYEFTFFLCAAVVYIYLVAVKKQRFNLWRERVKGVAAIFETAGQFFYVFAMASNAIVAAPLIASYSVFSVILSRLFLKERLSRLQYAVIVLVLAGIALLGLADEL